MKKNKLAASFAYDLGLIGVICSLPEYKVVWWINQQTQLHLVKQDDIEIELKGQSVLTISNFFFETDHVTIRLLSNRLVGDKTGSRVYLVNDLDQFQYLITIDDKYDTFDLQNFMGELKNIETIQYSTSIDIKKLKDKENLIL
ncbi:MAG: IPExxxVDY family protein [Cyclobacteriaceae bacterium]